MLSKTEIQNLTNETIITKEDLSNNGADPELLLKKINEYLDLFIEDTINYENSKRNKKIIKEWKREFICNANCYTLEAYTLLGYKFLENDLREEDPKSDIFIEEDLNYIFNPEVDKEDILKLLNHNEIKYPILELIYNNLSLDPKNDLDSKILIAIIDQEYSILKWDIFIDIRDKYKIWNRKDLSQNEKAILKAFKYRKFY